MVATMPAPATSAKTRKRRAVRARPDEPIRAVAYVRLSKAKAKPGDTEIGLETQLAGCERAVAAMGGSVVAVERDVQSGDRLDRLGLWRAIDRIQTGEANALIVYALDRFGRDQDQQGVAVIAIRQAGGRLLSATENLEEGPLGDLLRSVYGFAGALELAKIRERTNRAITAKFRQTRTLKPGHRPPYGYRKIGAGAAATYEAEPAEAAIVRRIFRERTAGASIRGIVAGLERDGVPSATKGGRWGEAMIRNILTRRAYWTGEHECWRTRTVRDADNVPWTEARPAEDRYTVPMPAIIDAALAARAEAAAERNVWKSHRKDRPAEVGVLRYGFARCGSCGRAMTVVTDAAGRAHYRCMRASARDRPCTAGACIGVDKLDGPFLNWLQAIIEDPARADTYRVKRDLATPDAAMLAAATAAEARVGELEEHVAGLVDKLVMFNGAAAEIAAGRVNALNGDLDAARAERDRLVAACRAAATAETAPTIAPHDALAAAIVEAIGAMIAADPKPAETFSVYLPLPGGALAEYPRVPLSWRSWQAALSVLDVAVRVAPAKSDAPRWAADLRPRVDVAVTTANGTGYLGMSR
jgi:site-specific DNA recombinase